MTSSSSSSLQASREIDYVLPESKSPSKIAYFEDSSLAVIVTHPWGMLGGNLHNNVVLAVVQYFQRLGITTARFDFCGSQLGRGYRQIDQVKEMADILLSGSSSSGSGSSTTTSTPWNRPTSKEDGQSQQQQQQRFPTRILLVGYSYGSIICGSASAKIPQCIGTVWIAPPFGSVSHFLLYCFAGNTHLKNAKQRTELPNLFLLGTQDNFTSWRRRLAIQTRTTSS